MHLREGQHACLLDELRVELLRVKLLHLRMIIIQTLCLGLVASLVASLVLQTPDLRTACAKMAFARPLSTWAPCHMHAHVRTCMCTPA